MCFLLKIAGKCFTVFSLGSGSESAEQLRSRSELSSVTAWSQGWSGASSKEMFQHNHGASSSMLCTVTPHSDTPQSPGSFLQELKQHLLPEISILQTSCAKDAFLHPCPVLVFPWEEKQ